MPKIERFEDIKAWQKARTLNQELWPLLVQLNDAKIWSLKEQMMRSAGSVMDNIVEGFERGSSREFLTFLGYAKASAGELRSQLYRAFDFGQINAQDFEKKKAQIQEVSRMIGGFMAYLKNTDHRGSRLSEPELAYETRIEVPEDFLA